MAIIKARPKQPKSVTIQARVEESIKFQLDWYAEFIDSTPSYIITEALKVLFRRDKEFKSWLSQHVSNTNGENLNGGASKQPAQHHEV
ncbi:MAG: hypothetical protein WAK33_13250 [Silvibacterium sp.]